MLVLFTPSDDICLSTLEIDDDFGGATGDCDISDSGRQVIRPRDDITMNFFKYNGETIAAKDYLMSFTECGTLVSILKHLECLKIK